MHIVILHFKSILLNTTVASIFLTTSHFAFPSHGLGRLQLLYSYFGNGTILQPSKPLPDHTWGVSDNLKGRSHSSRVTSSPITEPWCPDNIFPITARLSLKLSFVTDPKRSTRSWFLNPPL